MTVLVTTLKSNNVTKQKSQNLFKSFFVADGAGTGNPDEFTSCYIEKNMRSILQTSLNTECSSNAKLTPTTPINKLSNEIKKEIESMWQQIDQLPYTLEESKVRGLIENTTESANNTYNKRLPAKSKHPQIKKSYDDLQSIYEWCSIELIKRLMACKENITKVIKILREHSKSWVERYTESLKQENVMQPLIQNLVKNAQKNDNRPIHLLIDDYIKKQADNTLAKINSINDLAK
jgi:hypothetical protein